MRRSYPVMLMTLTLFVEISVSASFGAAAPGGGQAKGSQYRSERGRGNAQWSADPERGWVRADERHRLHEPSGNTPEKGGQVQQKSKTKSKKF